jgi:ribosomal protein L11 methyltransferase
VPYRLDVRAPAADAVDRLVDLGALDVERSDEGIAALLPDGVAPERAAGALGASDFRVSPVRGRDADSVWVLTPRPIQIGDQTLHLTDSDAFGTGLHPTTALCLEMLQEAVPIDRPHTVLDVGTGSGVLAIAALMRGVHHATGIDTDDGALRAAASNVRLNGVSDRLRLVRGGPDALTGTWPLVLANILPAPLVEMAPTLVRRVGHHGRLVLSGVPLSVEPDVHDAYRRLGMKRIGLKERLGWVVLELIASW